MREILRTQFSRYKRTSEREKMATEWYCDSTCIYVLGVNILPIGATMIVIIILMFFIGLVCIIIYQICLSSENKNQDSPSMKIYFDQRKIKFYSGEDVTINAVFENHSTEESVIWHKETTNGSHVVDTSLPKYFGIKKNTDNHMLVIRDCSELDTGKYYLSTNHRNKRDVFTSNKMQLDIIRALPKVTLNSEPEIFYGDCMEFKAMIRSFPKHTKVIWMKGNEVIDINQPNYTGSSDVGDCPVLRINNVKTEDQDEYTIEVCNELGNERCKRELKVIGAKPMVNLDISKQSQSVEYGNTITLEATIISRPAPTSIEWKKDETVIHSDMKKILIENSDEQIKKLIIRSFDFEDSAKYSITVVNAVGSAQDEFDINVTGNTLIFISGPVTVSPSDCIQLQTIFLPPTNKWKGKWTKTQNDITSNIDFETSGYKISTSSSKPTVQKIEIEKADGNGGTYQFALGTLKSNKIDVFVDESKMFATETEGNCLRYFALQDVSREAMRKTLDSMPESFETIWKRFMKYYNDKKRKCHYNLPSSPPSSSQELDVSLMYGIFYNAIDNFIPKKGWGKSPDVNDIGKADDIERLRSHRNNISHVESSNMTTAEFNNLVLDLIQAIRRLTTDDVQLMKKVCQILNKVFCKGSEMQKMMENLHDFKKLAAKEEELLKEFQDKNNISQEIDALRDKKAIHLNGNTDLYKGEKATIIAFIDSKISILSKVCWQKTDSNGDISTIDINEGKYTGSTTTLPSPELHIHFVRNEDEGTYRIVIDTFRTVVFNSIQLNVHNTVFDEIKDTEQDKGLKKIGFHEVHHDPNIVFMHNSTIAWKKDDAGFHGICFTNRSIDIGEKIYIRIAEKYANYLSSVEIALTNTNPVNITAPLLQLQMSDGETNTKQFIKYSAAVNDVICISVNYDATTSCYINDTLRFTKKLTYVSINDPVWLVFDLCGNTRAIEISPNKPKDTYERFSSIMEMP